MLGGTLLVLLPRSLRVILGALVNSHQIRGFHELEAALGEATGAYNNDVNELGVSPAQAALGRQPRMSGDVLGCFGQFLQSSWRTWVD